MARRHLAILARHRQGTPSLQVAILARHHVAILAHRHLAILAHPAIPYLPGNQVLLLRPEEGILGLQQVIQARSVVETVPKRLTEFCQSGFQRSC